MFNISVDGIISLTRGDCVSIPLFINKGTEIRPMRYELTDNDVIYVGICQPNEKFENAVVRKTYTKDNRTINSHGDLVISFNTKDTEYLEDGLYYYIVKLATTNEDSSVDVQTIIQKTKFYIED